MINFWHGPAAVGGVSVSTDCSVIVQENENAGTLAFALADPLRAEREIDVTLTPVGTGYKLTSKDDRITVSSINDTIQLKITSDRYGRSLVAEFERS